jgi:diguanylate cyclase (GGDEF)-like protein
MRRAVEKEEIDIGKDHPVMLTISAGIATVLPENRQGPEVLLRHADAALYQAKQQGRNRVLTAGSWIEQDRIGA